VSELPTGTVTFLFTDIEGGAGENAATLSPLSAAVSGT
jgi:hypothetical protein